MEIICGVPDTLREVLTYVLIEPECLVPALLA